MSDPANPNPADWLRKFGLSAFRPGQNEVINALLAGNDCLCIMPTGGGKSLCYQLPAVMRPGVVLVISPLIALMKDQVDGLQTLGLRATFVNSSLEPFEQGRRLDGMAAGEFDLVYVAPERMRSPKFLEALSRAQVQLLAVDEAHCISAWGHDFRPDYGRLGRLREKLGFPQTIALTATATPLVRRDVVQQLQLRSPAIFITGFARPNLRFEVHEPSSPRDKDEVLLEIVQETPGAGIIYAATRKKCEAVVEFLRSNQKRPVGLYHAGLLPAERRSIQDQFMAGKVPLIVATNAFGMGIDKRDLRVVIHYNIPGSLEAYYQEAGRAGRDGLPSRCVLLFSYADRYIQEFFIENSYPSRDAVRRVYEFLRLRPEDPIEMTLQEIKQELGLSLSGEGVGVCEQLLEKCGVLERLESQQNMAQVKLESNLPTLVELLPKEAKVQRKVLRELEREVDDRRGEWVPFHPAKIAAAVELDREALNRALRELIRLTVFHYVPPFRGRAIHMLRRDIPFEQLAIAFEELERRKAAELEKLERVISFAQSHGCRQREILRYFGDSQRFRCGICDNCQPELLSSTTPGSATTENDDSILEAVRIVLSGAARTQGSVGKNLLAKMLCGSQSVQISQLRLDKLSTFGLLSDLNQTDVVEFIKSLIRAKLLEQTEPQPRRPVVQLTEFGGQVMRKQQDLPAWFTLPSELVARLRKRRQPSARRHAGHASVAPSFSRSPVPIDDFPTRDMAAAAEKSPPESCVTSNFTPRPNFYWTWRLFQDGYSLAECRAIRDIDDQTLLDHLLRAANDGLAIQLDWVLNAEQHQLLAQVVDDSSSSGLRAMIDNLPPGIGVQHVQLFCQIRDATAKRNLPASNRELTKFE